MGLGVHRILVLAKDWLKYAGMRPFCYKTRPNLLGNSS